MLVALLAATGCGDAEDDPGRVLSETAAHLGEIRSGELRLELKVTPRGRGLSGEVGFVLDGPFALRGAGRLPVARIRYTQLAGSRRAQATLISTRERAWVDAGAGARPLSAAQRRQLEQAAPGERGLAELGLELEDWLDDPSTSDGPQLDGEPTTRVRGRLDVAAALADIARALPRATGAAAPLDADARRAIREAVSSARVELVSGREDRLLRRLELKLRFDGLRELERLLGLRAADLELRLTIDRVNRPVAVRPPL